MIGIEKVKGELKKYKYVYVAVFFIFVLGVFLRVYKFDSLMHFELDQARDIFVIKGAIENGIENLPLLGPQARGKELYLGPIFYYFSYVSSLIFGISPRSMALPDLLFSIFSIPLFYLFARLFLSIRWVAISITAILSTSLFLVTYGRFAWNPNGMFFWSLLTFYSLLRAYEDRKLKAKWFLLFVFSLSILTQLHFIAFVSVPLVVLFYLVMVKIRIPWRVALGSFFILLFLYSPVILSEIKTKGRNIDSFLDAIKLNRGIETVDDREDGANRGFAEKTLRAFQETSTFYWNIVSSDNNGGYNIRIKKDDQKFFRIICNENCKNNLGHHFLAILIFVFSLGAFLFSFVKIFNKKRFKDDLVIENIFNRHLLLFLWLFFGEIFLILVAYQISPRFYLYLAAPFLILLGILFELIGKSFSWGKWFVVTISILLFGLNLFKTTEYLKLLNGAKIEKDPLAWNDIVLNQNDIVTLEQLRMAGKYLNSLSVQSEKFLIIGDNNYARAFYYVVAVENENNNALCYIKRAGIDVSQLKNKTYYVLTRTKSKDQIDDNMLVTHEIGDWKNFGTINLYKMVPDEYDNKILLPNQCFKN